jgi:imidazolonepropionase-like amidohydrolase
MKPTILALCVAVFLAFAAAPHAQRGAAGTVTAIVGARLVDGTGAAPVNDSVILVSGDRITAAGPRARVPVPQGATVVDASGKTVLPGLIDVHCHLNQPEDVMRKLLPVALNWGVTTLRMTGNDKPEIMQVYYDAREGKNLWPRVYTAGQGFNLTGPYPGAPTMKPATPEEARKGVQAHKALKVDFIKLWMADKGGFSPEIVEAIVDEAKKQNIPVVAHIGNVAQVKQLAELGVKDFMHEARDGMNPEFIAYAKAKGLSFAPTLGQGQSRWFYYEHPEFLTMDPKFVGFYARGRAIRNAGRKSSARPTSPNRSSASKTTTIHS